MNNAYVILQPHNNWNTINEGKNTWKFGEVLWTMWLYGKLNICRRKIIVIEISAREREDDREEERKYKEQKKDTCTIRTKTKKG